MFTVAHLYDIDPGEVQIRDYEVYGNGNMVQVILGEGDGTAVLHFTGENVLDQIESVGARLSTFARHARKARAERELADAKTEALKDDLEVEKILREVEEKPDVEPF